MLDAPRTREKEATAAFDQVAVSYPYEKDPAVGPVSLAVRAGERVLLLGPSGCGKSTLLLALTGLIPKTIPGEVAGTIRLSGEPVDSRDPAGWADHVAHFFQDADQTLCGMRVEDEIAFALENRALPEAEIATRVTAAMRLVGLPEDWRTRRTMTLSGGEKQLVALAATLVQEAPLFVADEPTAHLAPEAASRLHRLLVDTDPERAVLIVDHRLDGLITSVDRVIMLGGDGRILAEGPPRAVFRQMQAELAERGIWMPLASGLDAELAKAGIAPEMAPLTLDEIFSALDARKVGPEQLPKARAVVSAFVDRRLPAQPVSSREALARLEDADCAPFMGPVVLHGVTMEIRAGEVLGILGRNGAGKSTLAACLAGVSRPKRGRRTGPLGGIAFQKPESQFTEGSVLDELMAALPRLAGKEEKEAQAQAILARWGLAELSRRHPYELSQGQKRRLALAALTATDRWPFLVLDEPLAGLDARGAAQVEADIERLRQAGRAVALVTHDMDFALKLCGRSVLVAEGGILVEGPTRELLADGDLLARAGLQPPSIMPALRWLERTAPC
ncbi:ATP-binding cassette domain-containing protein [Chelativorans sp.]|uniref:ABC transporter ATP-binding protein n=1 Tax=Chelativorans sp. TaxID=2203393 RepID=UPI002811D19F|nr:ATP-binding cassette domain-containing protein [Chelativorans sp.]